MDTKLTEDIDFIYDFINNTEDCTIGQPYYRHKADGISTEDAIGAAMIDPAAQIRRAFTPTQTGKLILNWDNVVSYVSSMRYVIRPNLAGDDYDIYRYNIDTGYYESVPFDTLAAQTLRAINLNKPAGAVVPSNFTQMFMNNVLPCIPEMPDGHCFYEIQDLAKYYTDGEVIPFRNGIYSIRHNKLLPKTEYIFIDHPLNVDFNPKALTHEISERYLEIMCGDKELFEDLFEQVGYAMYARTFVVPRFTIFTNANGSNGKSVVIDAIRAIVGDTNISTASMYDLSNKFSIAETEGKLINISSDSSKGINNSNLATASSAEFIKKSTSGEPYTFDKKNKKVHQGYGPRKFIFATNVEIRFDSADGGLARRMGVIPFNNYFEDNRIMAAKFKEESAIEWFAMQSLVSFICFILRGMRAAGVSLFDDVPFTGKFMVTESAKEEKISQLCSQNNIYEWVYNDLNVDPLDRQAVHKAIMAMFNDPWASYSQYTDENGGMPSKHERFNKFIQQYGIITKQGPKTDGRRTYYISADPNFKLKQ